MTLDYRWAVGIGTLLVAIVVSAALLFARNTDTLEAVQDSQDCMIELLLIDPDARTIDTVRESCPSGSIPDREPSG